MKKLRNFSQNDSGLAAIEFALMFPVIMAMYLGAIVVYDFLEHKRDTSHSANTIVDLVARQSNVTNKSLDEMMSIAKAFSRTKPKTLKVRVANIEYRNGANRVVWSRGSNWRKLEDADLANMNVPVLAEYDSIIVVQVKTKASPLLKIGDFKKAKLTHTAYRRPLYVEFINKGRN